jgi:hypothetical protein
MGLIFENPLKVGDVWLFWQGFNGIDAYNTLNSTIKWGVLLLKRCIALRGELLIPFLEELRLTLDQKCSAPRKEYGVMYFRSPNKSKLSFPYYKIH